MAQRDAAGRRSMKLIEDDIRGELGAGAGGDEGR